MAINNPIEACGGGDQFLVIFQSDYHQAIFHGIRAVKNFVGEPLFPDLIPECSTGENGNLKMTPRDNRKMTPSELV